MAYATADDVAELLGRDLTESEAGIVERRLNHAEELLLHRIPDLAERAENLRYFRLLVMVEADMILRLIRNPEGYRQETDSGYGYTIDDRVASGRLQALPEELQLLGVSGAKRIALSIKHGVTRQEGEHDPYRPKSGPATRDFEIGLDTGVWA